MGVISIGVVPMGVVSLGVVAMGVVNASIVGMGVISAGLTTMGVLEWTPRPNNHLHHGAGHQEKKQSQFGTRHNELAYPTKAEAEKNSKRLGCKGVHRMGNMWRPCASHNP